MDGGLISPPGLVAGRAVGAGGGGGKAGGGFTAAKDTNRSRAIVRLIDVLCEGPILGLEDGGKSIYFNNTPVIAPDGSENFRGVSWDIRLGLPDQEPIPGFPIAESTIPIEAEVKNDSGPVVRSITSDTATMARVIMRFPALFYQNTKQNKLEQTSLHYTIEVRPVGGTYFVAHNVNMAKAKWMSPYEREHMVSLPASPTGSWDIRVTKLTADPDPAQGSPSASSNTNILQNTVILASIGEITERKLTYPDTALIAISFDAAYFGSSLPQRWYKLKGRLVKVPVNYDPVTRTYATSGTGVTGGMWDGVTFKTAWTNNPAWVFYDAIINTRFGCSIDESLLAITRFELYMIGQYCDELVPDGYGGYEPRYSLNAWINSSDDAYRFMQRIVQSFRGMSFWAAGQVSVTADMPQDPVKLVTNANVVEGNFTYEGASLKSMHTMARVGYMDPNNNYEKNVEIVDDPERLAQFGERVVDIEAFGCTSRGEAHRLGKWALDTERHSTEMVSYETGLDQVDLVPGDIIAVQDRWYSGVRGGGRVRDVGLNWVLLDAPFDTSGSGHKLSVMKADGTPMSDIAIASFNTSDPEHTKVTISGNFSETPVVNSIWMIASDTVPARQFRVLAVQEHKRGQARVTALLHDPHKYSRVEGDLSFDDVKFHDYTPASSPIAAPSGVDATTTIYGTGMTSIMRVSVSWTPASDGRVMMHEVAAEWGQDGSQRTVNVPEGSTADFDELVPGNYRFYVRSIAVDGRSSEWVASDTIAIQAIGANPDAPTGLTAVASSEKTTVTWVASVSIAVQDYEIYRSSTSSFAAGSSLGYVATTNFTDGNGDILAAGVTFYYWIRARSVVGMFSNWSGPISVTIPTWGLPDIPSAGGSVTTPNFDDIPITIWAPRRALVQLNVDLSVTTTTAVNASLIRQNHSNPAVFLTVYSFGALTSSNANPLSAEIFDRPGQGTWDYFLRFSSASGAVLGSRSLKVNVSTG